MSKLFRLKEWLTVDEAAQHLSKVLDEPIQEKDIYRLALDKQLRLSVNFINDTEACLGVIVETDAMGLYENLEDNIYDYFTDRKDPLRSRMKLLIDKKRAFKFEHDVRDISGVWDLTMLGGEYQDIEHIYQNLISGSGLISRIMGGTFVQRGGKISQLMERFDNNEYQSDSVAQRDLMEATSTQKNIPDEKAVDLRQDYQRKMKTYLGKNSSANKEDDTYPANGLPNDAVLVVKTNAIIDFLNSLDEQAPQTQKPLNTKERNTLLVMIAALCKEADIEYNKKGVVVAIEKMTENIGAPVTDDTIRKVLSQIEEAIISRSK